MSIPGLVEHSPLISFLNHRRFNQFTRFNYFFTLRGEFLELQGNRRTALGLIAVACRNAYSGNVCK